MKFVLAFILSFILVTRGDSQTTTVSGINITIYDKETKRKLDSVLITISGPDTITLLFSGSRDTVFRITNIKSGKYDIKVQKQNYSTLEITGFITAPDKINYAIFEIRKIVPKRKRIRLRLRN